MNLINSAFTKKAKKLSFRANPEEAKNLLLSFTVENGDGRLMIELNGDEIFNKETEGNEIIPLNINQYNNELIFFVDSPGWAFFNKHEYDLTNIKVTADVKDLSRSEATQTFSISEEEYNNMERAELKLFPICNTKQTGQLTIFINGVAAYKTIPDCGVIIKHDLDLENLQQGSNKIMFSSTEGSYIVDNVEIRTYSNEKGNPSYFFDMDKDYFDNEGDLKEEYDVYAQFLFTDDDSIKEAEVKVNEHGFSFRTRENTYERKISDWVEEGTNRIEIIPEKKMDIARLKVVVES